MLLMSLVDDTAMGVLRIAENITTKRMVRMLSLGWMNKQVLISVLEE